MHYSEEESLSATRHRMWVGILFVKSVVWWATGRQADSRTQSHHWNGKGGEHSPDKWMGHNDEGTRTNPQRLRLGLDLRSSCTMDIPELEMLMLVMLEK